MIEEIKYYLTLNFTMYFYKDTKEDIPNTFNTVLLENKYYCIPEIIYLLDKNFIERKDLPENVLKRADAEIKFIMETQVQDTKIENIPNTFAPRTRNKMFSIDMIIHGLRFGFLQMGNLPPDIRKRVNDVLESRKPSKKDLEKYSKNR